MHYISTFSTLIIDRNARCRFDNNFQSIICALHTSESLIFVFLNRKIRDEAAKNIKCMNIKLPVKVYSICNNFKQDLYYISYQSDRDISEYLRLLRSTRADLSLATLHPAFDSQPSLF